MTQPANVFEEIAAKKQELDLIIKTQGKETMEVFLKDFLAKHPTIARLTWAQYTPYFNDGEECVFHMNDLYAKFKDPLYDGPYDKEFDDNGYFGEEGWSCYSKYHLLGVDYKGDPRELTKREIAMILNVPLITREALLDLNKMLKANEDVLKVAFGDHVSVTVTAEGIEVEEYDHD